MDRHAFLSSLSFTCPIPSSDLKLLEKQESFFSGYCCFMTRPYKSSSQNNEQFLYFKITEKCDDVAQLKLQLSLLQVNKEYLLCANFDEKQFIVDHTQILKISRPSKERDETPFIGIEFPTVALRIYLNPESQTSASQATHILNGCVDTMLAKLKPHKNINKLLQQLKKEEQKLTCGSKDFVRGKYSNFVKFLNLLNRNSVLFHEGMEELSNGKELEELVDSYNNAIITASEIKMVKKEIEDGMSNGKSDVKTVMDEPLYATPQFNEKDDDEMAECEEKLMKEMDEQLSKMFYSSSQTQVVVSDSALNQLEQKIQKMNELSELEVLLSTLPQKRFSI